MEGDCGDYCGDFGGGMDAGFGCGEFDFGAYGEAEYETMVQHMEDQISIQRRALKQSAKQLDTMNARQREAYQRDVQALKKMESQLRQKQKGVMMATATGKMHPRAAAAANRSVQQGARQLQYQRNMRDRAMGMHNMRDQHMRAMMGNYNAGLNANEYALNCGFHPGFF